MTTKIDEAKNLIQKGKLKEGIALLLEAAPPEFETPAGILSAKVNELYRQNALGIISYRDFSVEFSKNAEAVLDILKEIDQTWNDAQKARYLFQQAVEFNKEKKFDQALTLLDQAYEIDPGNSLILIERALAKMSIFLFSEAIVDLSEAIGKKPLNPYAYFLRAQAYEVMGYREKAEEDKEKLNEFGIHFSHLK